MEYFKSHRLMQRPGQGAVNNAPWALANLDENLKSVPRGLASQPLSLAQRDSSHRLSFQESLQILGKIGRAGVSPIWLLFQALEANCFQIARHLGLQPNRRG